MCAVEVDKGMLGASIDALLDEQIAAGEFPGAAWAVRFRSGEILAGARGQKARIPRPSEAEVSTIWDAASLTKPLVTAALTLLAVKQGRIGLDDPVDRLVPELHASPAADRITVVDLLTHRAGFQAWYPLYVEGNDADSYVAAIARRPLRYWPGSAEIYSCLGFILLGVAIERLFDRSLRDLAAELLFVPLGLRDSCLVPDDALRGRIAPTEFGNAHEKQMVRDRGLSFAGFRESLIHGEVNDGNAFHMGGAAGNAGLFSTASEVVQLAAVWLEGGVTILSPALAAAGTRNHSLGFAENRGFGWLLRSDAPAHPAAPLSRGSFGHTGFTGCSVWCDPSRGVAVALMTNRIHPRVEPTAIQAVRRRLNELVAGSV